MQLTKFMLVVIFILGAQIAPTLGSGHIETLLPFDIEANELTEGVAVDADGNIFVSLSPLGQIVKVVPGLNSAESFASVSGLMEGDLGILGVAVSEAGNVYGAVVSANPDVNGVWMFDGMSGEGQHVFGTEAILLPNAISFGANGTMYVTDSIMGAIWRVEDGGSAEVWKQDPLLEGNESLGFGIPIGANGIAVLEDTVYVGITETASIVTVQILSDGSAGDAELWAALPEGNHADGIALDTEGNVIVAAPTINEIQRVHADATVDTLATSEDSLDAPASVVFVIDSDGHQAIYAVNFSVAVAPPGGAGPALLKIDLGETDSP